MLSYISEQKLKNLLIAVGNGEKDLETARQRLSSIRDFALKAAFERFDRDADSSIAPVEIINFLRDQGIFHVLESEAVNLVQFFDSDANGHLNFSEFIQIFLPCEDNVLRNTTIDRPSINVGKNEHLPRDIEHALATVIEKEINFQRRIESLKRDLQIGLDYSPSATFKTIDRPESGVITSVNLGEFFKKLGHFTTESELLAIIRRIDTDGDAQLNLQEFTEFLKPLAHLVSSVPLISSFAPLHDPYFYPYFYPSRYHDYPYSRYHDYPYSRYHDYPYYSRYPDYSYSRYYDYPMYSRYYPSYPRYIDYPAVARTETVEVERPTYYSPSRTVKRTTYHTPTGDRTYTSYI